MHLTEDQLKLITEIASQQAIKASQEEERIEDDEFLRLIGNDENDSLSALINWIEEDPDPILNLSEEVLNDFFKHQKKRQIPTSIKRQVEEKCEGKCYKCQSEESLNFHHIKPFSEGGKHTVENIILLCAYCHAEEHKGERVYNMMISRIGGQE